MLIIKFIKVACWSFIRKTDTVCNMSAATESEKENEQYPIKNYVWNGSYDDVYLAHIVVLCAGQPNGLSSEPEREKPRAATLCAHP